MRKSSNLLKIGAGVFVGVVMASLLGGFALFKFLESYAGDAKDKHDPQQITLQHEFMAQQVVNAYRTGQNQTSIWRLSNANNCETELHSALNNNPNDPSISIAKVVNDVQRDQIFVDALLTFKDGTRITLRAYQGGFNTCERQH